MKRVFSSDDGAVIEIVRALLARDGIETNVFNENLAAATGMLPFFFAMPEIWVIRDDDEQPAKAIVARFESGELREELPNEPWTCPKCGQMIEGQFTECWQCDLPDPRGHPASQCPECG